MPPSGVEAAGVKLVGSTDRQGQRQTDGAQSRWVGAHGASVGGVAEGRFRPGAEARSALSEQATQALTAR